MVSGAEKKEKVPLQRLEKSRGSFTGDSRRQPPHRERFSPRLNAFKINAWGKLSEAEQNRSQEASFSAPRATLGLHPALPRRLAYGLSLWTPLPSSFHLSLANGKPRELGGGARSECIFSWYRPCQVSRAVSITSPISPAPVKMILLGGSHSTLGCSLLFLMLDGNYSSIDSVNGNFIKTFFKLSYFKFASVSLWVHKD